VRYTSDYLNLIHEALQKATFGLITDVDGTISKTAPTPQEAKVSPRCRHYLSRLHNHLALVAAISGRPAADVRNMIGIYGIVYIGNHGLERWTNDHSELLSSARDYPRVVKSVIDELTPLLSMEGISIENKGVTASIHYRLSPQPQLAEREILKALEASPQAGSLRIIRERMAVDLLPPIEINKGTTTLDLIRDYNLQGGVYLGDDFTDIDAFRAIHTACRDLAFQGFAIGITSPEMPEELVTEADFTLNGVSDVERFLKWMLENAPQSS